MSEKTRQYYRERVKNHDRDKFLWQVGKTVNGEEVSREQIELILKTIVNRLQLDKSDIALDIGCGNGLLTKEISRYVSKITGIELTPELYEIAKEYNSASNISYINYDVLGTNAMGYDNQFTKVYLYEVIQHLNFQEVDALFAKLNEITADRATIFIGGILDVEKKWMFFDTVERRCLYFKGLLSGSEPLGTWYHKEFFSFLANKHNMNGECLSQENNLYTSHYRYDCLLQKN
jgi:cyclopropane fatty-acyl-phospholipid synthase-like methyltransferase